MFYVFPLNPILKLIAKMGSYIRHLHFMSSLSNVFLHILYYIYYEYGWKCC